MMIAHYISSCIDRHYASTPRDKTDWLMSTLNTSDQLIFEVMRAMACGVKIILLLLLILFLLFPNIYIIANNDSFPTLFMLMSHNSDLFVLQFRAYYFVFNAFSNKMHSVSLELEVLFFICLRIKIN